MPRISVIITTFNRATFLKKAVESVLSQTYPDFELLILDNSSTDNTEEVVKSFNDNKIRYIKHNPLNISQARNLGVKESRGEYIAFLDDDDEWLPDKTEKELEVFYKKDRHLALVYGGFVRIDSDGKEMGIIYPTLKGMILKDLLDFTNAFTGSASNPMMRKSAIQDIGGYNEEVTTGEDWELYLRLAEKYSMDFTPVLVVKIRAHMGARLGDKLKDAARLEMMLMKRYSHIFEEDKKLKSFYLQTIGGKFIRCKEIYEGRKFIALAIKTNPFNYVAWFQYLLTIFGQDIYSYIHRIYLRINRSINKR